jgi:hypothetical protein
MIRRAACVVALALLGALLIASTALAASLVLPPSMPPELRALLRERTQPSSQSPNFESRFALDAGHGYELAVVGQGSSVLVEVGRPASFQQTPLFGSQVGTAQALTIYAARGTVTRHRIAASFGKFGKVDVRFHPAGPPVESRAQHHCRGADHFTIQHGAFVGSVRFTGEDNYVTAHSHRVRGRVRTPLRLDCAPPRPHSQDRSLQRAVHQIDFGFGASLGASSRHGVDSTELFTFGIRKTQLTFALAEASMGSMAELHFGLAVSRPKVLSVNDALTSATLAPPAPFHGTGTYSAAPDGTKTWTGPLTIAFPGAPRWPLTGEQFKVTVDAGF